MVRLRVKGARKGLRGGRRAVPKRFRGRKRRFAPVGRGAARVVRMPEQTPQRMIIPLKYVERTTLTSNVGALTEALYSGNGMFDPTIAVGGHQPLGYDQWSALYENYRVYASKFTVEIMPTDSTIGATSFRCVMLCSTTTSSSTGMDLAAEQKYAKSWTVNLYQAGLKYKSYMTTARMFGVAKRRVRDDDLFQAATAANPTNQWYWRLVVATADATSTGVLRVYFKVKYYAEFFNPVELASS